MSDEREKAAREKAEEYARGIGCEVSRAGNVALAYLAGHRAAREEAAKKVEERLVFVGAGNTLAEVLQILAAEIREGR